ncbi:MAG: hypothetical protein WDN48_16240 [Pseudolabrys sp.]
MAGVGHNRIGELDVAVGQRLGVRQRAEIRHRVVGRVEAFGSGILQPCHRGPGLRRQLAVADPQRRVAARGVELFDRLAFRLAFDLTVELAGDDAAQLVGDLRVAGGKRPVGGDLGFGSDGRRLRRGNRRLDARLGRSGQRLRARGLGHVDDALHRRRQGRGRIAMAQRLSVQRRRQRFCRLDSVGRRDGRRGDDQCQHSAGQQSLEPFVTHHTQLHELCITRMDRIVRSALTDRNVRTPSTELHRYYAAERAPRRMNFSGLVRFLCIKANAIH